MLEGGGSIDSYVRAVEGEVGGWYGDREGGWLYLAKSIQVETETPVCQDMC